MGSSRNTNLECLRIASMLLIVASHYVVHADFSTILNEPGVSFNRIFLQTLMWGGPIGVSCFVLLSAYFLSASSFKIDRLLRLWFTLLFYSLGITILFFFIYPSSFSLSEIIKSLLPLTRRIWWFPAAYSMMYIFSPLLNKIIYNITKEQHLIIIIVTTFCWIIMPTLYLGHPNTLESNDLLMFFYLYFIAAFIRLYPTRLCHIKASKALMVVGLVFLLRILSTLAIDFYGQKTSFFPGNFIVHLIGKQNVLAFLLSFFLFLLFKNLQVQKSNVLNLFASGAFGVYLIHDHPKISPILWSTICQNKNYCNSIYLWLHSIVCVFLVFVLFSLFDVLRKNTIERMLINFIHKTGLSINLILEFITERFLRML